VENSVQLLKNTSLHGLGFFSLWGYSPEPENLRTGSNFFLTYALLMDTNREPFILFPQIPLWLPRLMH